MYMSVIQPWSTRLCDRCPVFLIDAVIVGSSVALRGIHSIWLASNKSISAGRRPRKAMSLLHTLLEKGSSYTTSVIETAIMCVTNAHIRPIPPFPLVYVATRRKVPRYPLDPVPTMSTGFHLECERFRLLGDSDVRLPCKPSLVRPVLSASFRTPAVFGCGKDFLSLSRPAITLSAALAFVALPTGNPLDCLGVPAATKAMLSRTPSSSFFFESLYWASASSSL